MVCCKLLFFMRIKDLIFMKYIDALSTNNCFSGALKTTKRLFSSSANNVEGFGYKSIFARLLSESIRLLNVGW